MQGIGKQDITPMASNIQILKIETHVIETRMKIQVGREVLEVNLRNMSISLPITGL